MKNQVLKCVGTFVAAITVAATASAGDAARLSTTPAKDGGRIVVEVEGPEPEVPLFFSATVDQVIRLGVDELAGSARLKLRVVQGKPEVLSLGLSGDGEIIEVSGAGLRDWSVRQGVGADSGKRFLDLRPLASPAGVFPTDLEVLVRSRVREPDVPGTHAVLLVTPGDAVGFSSSVTLNSQGSVDLSLGKATGMVPLNEDGRDDARNSLQFFSTTDGRIEVGLSRRGGAVADAEMLGARLRGTVNEDADSVNFVLRGSVRAAKAGARFKILSGGAALSGDASGDGWHVELVFENGTSFYEFVCDREGAIPVGLNFAAALAENGDWRRVDFRMPVGAVVPLRLDGVEKDVEFDSALAVVPNQSADGWQGFLPGDGTVSLAWKDTREAEEGSLFFTTVEHSDVRVGAGLLRQWSQINFRILQGKLTSVNMLLDGPGEILAVEGASVVGWKVVPGDDSRRLEVAFSRPIEGEGSLVIRSQTALGGFPVRAEPIRLTPEGVVRHTGMVRIANSGAVRLEVTDVSGMLQLAPGQFPGGQVEEGVRQTFVYRFPSAARGYRVVANQIQPEVGVSQIVMYELVETDRVIRASLELDIREAPLRDWSIAIPEDYAVVAVDGNGVADYAIETDAVDGYRLLKVLFGRAVQGRQLLRLRLEKNQAASAGEWQLPPLRYPNAKTVRGHVGAVSVPGYRMAPISAESLVEVPLSYFPTQVVGLQQAWRLREAEWTARLQIEALGQSVQADVFHLYSLKEGVVYGSVLINYFVVGAPSSEWRIEVPASVGNIDVVGQNVRRDWRREGDDVIISLHQPVLGAATLLVTFEQPMSARGGTITPGEVRPLGVQAERGFIQIVSPLQVKHEVLTDEGGLLKLEPLELPTEYRLLTSSPSLGVYQYTARPFSFEMGVEWYDPGETVDQVVDFAKLSSQVSRDGQVVTDARFFVKTRGRQALRMILPEGMQLWEAQVDNEVVAARADGNQTLVPLPARINPNDPVEVALRFGQAAVGSGSKVNLTAPQLLVPTVINEWILHCDPERLLVPSGGNADLVRQLLRPTGFEALSRLGLGTLAILFGLVAATIFLLRGSISAWSLVGGIVTCGIAIFMALGLAVDASAIRWASIGELTYSATVVPAGEAVSIQVANLEAARAMTSWTGIFVGIAGLGLLVVGLIKKFIGPVSPRVLVGAGAAAIGFGLLAQRGGGAYFFATLVLVLSVGIVLTVFRWFRSRGGYDDTNGAGAPVVASIIAITGLLGFALSNAPSAEAQEQIMPQPPVVHFDGKAAEAIIQKWTIREERLFAEIELTVRGKPGDSFLLLSAPAVLTNFESDGLRVGTVERFGSTAYYVAPTRDGTLTAVVTYEMPVPEDTRALVVPTGPAATQRVTLELDQGGWEFTSPMAVQVVPTAGLAADRSGATVIFAPTGKPFINFAPKSRDIAAEETQFFVEASNLFVPGPGVVNGYTRVTVRPAQGRVSRLELQVADGFTVGDVRNGPVGEWRFDPRKRRLTIAIEPAQTGVFNLDIETQLGTADLPIDLSLEPLRVVSAAGEVGMIAIAFGGDAQPEALRPTDLSPINVEDFDASLLPRGRNGETLAVLQNVWRYGQEGGRLQLKVAPVAPEVRVGSRQVLSLDDDRLVMAVDLSVSITRVGLFNLSFVLPDGMEVESLSGPSLSHWTEAEINGKRLVTLHLNGRTIGEQTFALTLAGPAPEAQASWSVPKLLLGEATRQTGELLLVPGKGIRLRAVDRENATQLDPRSVGGMQPGTLAFRLLQENWALGIGIEILDPWVTAQSLQEVTVREGQTLTRISVRYRIENASVKQLRVRLPGLTEEQIRTVRGSGSAVSDFVPVPGEADLWEIRFQRGVAGDADVQIEFQGQAERVENNEQLTTPEFVGSRQTVQFVAVRSGGRLELQAGEVPRGWQRVDWSAVPVSLQDNTDRSVPALCYRVAEPEAALVVKVDRHDVADALKLRVTDAALTTIFSPAGSFLTAVDLRVDVIEKSTLRVRLPVGSRLFNTIVNGETVSAVREGDFHLFYVSPTTETDRSASVRLVYAVPELDRGRIELLGPSLSVPLENVSWRVVVPPGYQLADYDGNLQLREERHAGVFDIDSYVSMSVKSRQVESQKAVAMLEEASSLLQRGEQQQASEVLARAANFQGLDEASNEDARVQLRALKTQQAVLGLNTRRQRLYLDNRADAQRNEQLEQAATLNPFMQGRLNFDPQQVDQLLMGNTLEENAALRGIATRIVDQQLAAEPAPGAIDVTLPERGRVLTFTRSLQVDGGAPLDLSLSVEKAGRTSVVTVLAVLAALAVFVGVLSPRWL